MLLGRVTASAYRVPWHYTNMGEGKGTHYFLSSAPEDSSFLTLQLYILKDHVKTGGRRSVNQ